MKCLIVGGQKPQKNWAISRKLTFGSKQTTFEIRVFNQIRDAFDFTFFLWNFVIWKLWQSEKIGGKEAVKIQASSEFHFCRRKKPEETKISQLCVRWNHQLFHQKMVEVIQTLILNAFLLIIAQKMENIFNVSNFTSLF